jgi:hypothetical protein
MTVYDIHVRLGRLAAERRAAIDAGLGANAVYMDRLEDEMQAARAAYVGLGVTAIACLRGELFGVQQG